MGVILEDEYAKRALEFEYTSKSGIQLQITGYCFSLENTKGTWEKYYYVPLLRLPLVDV